MPKYSLYLPDDLLASMKEFKGTPQDPNWSALAQEAFRLEVQRLKNRKEGASKMEAAVERLRASKAKRSNEDHVEGHGRGRAWALNHAEYDELERAANFAETSYQYLGEPNWNAPHGGAGWFYAAVADEEGSPDHAEVREFWERYADTESPSGEFVRGFAEGAAEVFEEVKDQV